MKNQFLFFKKYSCILVKSEGNKLDTHSDHIYKEYAHYKTKSTCHKRDTSTFRNEKKLY